MQKENASWSLDYVLEKESPTWARSRWRCAASDCWLSRVMWPDSCTTHSSGSASSTPWCQTEKCTFPGIGNENRIRAFSVKTHTKGPTCTKHLNVLLNGLSQIIARIRTACKNCYLSHIILLTVPYRSFSPLFILCNSRNRLLDEQMGKFWLFVRPKDYHKINHK